MKLVVSKFGGSSMKDHEAMLRSAKLSLKRNSNVVLVSATYNTTDQLLSLISHAENGQWHNCEKVLFQIKEKHLDILYQLTKCTEAKERIKQLSIDLHTLTKGIYLIRECSLKTKDRIISFGERVSSILFAEAIKMSTNEKTVIHFDSRKIIRTDSTHGKAKPLIIETKKCCNEYFKFNDQSIYIGQGFISSDLKGSTTTLGRGGSDYSAALIAEAIDANLLEIWTDVAGLASTDPRVCEEARPILEINYEEASEMAQYGAKILHPTTLVPAMRSKIPVYVGSSLDPEAGGTWIKNTASSTPLVRAITNRPNQVLLTIRTAKMLSEYGFIGKIFEIITKNKINVDCITTSEISIAVSVDIATIQNEIFMNELKSIGEVQTEHHFSLISLIGNKMLDETGLALRVFQCLKNVNVRMICVGSSAYNFNILISQSESDTSIRSLHQEFIK